MFSKIKIVSKFLNSLQYFGEERNGWQIYFVISLMKKWQEAALC